MYSETFVNTVEMFFIIILLDSLIKDLIKYLWRDSRNTETYVLLIFLAWSLEMNGYKQSSNTRS